LFLCYAFVCLCVGSFLAVLVFAGFYDWNPRPFCVEIGFSQMNFGPLCFCVVGIYRDSFGCLGFVEDARNYVAWGGE